MGWKLTDALGRQKQIITNNANTSGLLSARPAPGVLPGGFYYATDQVVLWYSDGTNWYRQGPPAGSTYLWFNAVAPAGHVLYDGSILGSSTGIYADIFAHLGTTTLPDTRGRMPVGLGPNAAVSTIGNNEGIGTAANRRPQHRTTNSLSGATFSGTTGGGGSHGHNVYTEGGGATNPGAFQPARSDNSGTAGPYGSTTDPGNHTHSFSGTTAAPGGSIGTNNANDPVDTSPFITFAYIAKL